MRVACIFFLSSDIDGNISQKAIKLKTTSQPPTVHSCDHPSLVDIGVGAKVGGGQIPTDVDAT